MINWKPEALQEAVDAWFGYQVNLSTEIAKQISKALNAAVEAQGELEIDYWKNRTREALETIKGNLERIAELQQLVARIVEHNDIDSDVPEHIRWEILVADARKVLGEKE